MDLSDYLELQLFSIIGICLYWMLVIRRVFLGESAQFKGLGIVQAMINII